MGVMLFVVFAAMEIGLAALKFTKYKSRLAAIVAEIIFSAVEFAVMLLVMLLPVTDHKVRYVGCFLIFGIRLVFSIISLIVKFIKKAVGRTEKDHSQVGVIFGCFANVVLIFCFVFPTIVFPGFKEMEEKDNGVSVMRELLDESNKNADAKTAELNTKIFEYIISE